MDPRKKTELLCPLQCGESQALMPATPLVDDLEATVRSSRPVWADRLLQADRQVCTHRKVGAERELHSGLGCAEKALRK